MDNRVYKIAIETKEDGSLHLFTVFSDASRFINVSTKTLSRLRAEKTKNYKGFVLYWNIEQHKATQKANNTF